MHDKIFPTRKAGEKPTLHSAPVVGQALARCFTHLLPSLLIKSLHPNAHFTDEDN